jgi:hypothetical protein
MAKVMNPADEKLMSTIARLAKETWAPIRDSTLKKVGAAVADIRINLDDEGLYQIKSVDKKPQDDRAWSRSLVPSA